jgi:deoxyribonuclease V
MYACVDVHYHDDRALAACALFKNWSDAMPSSQFHTTISKIMPYIAGKFYLRELPCILKVLELVNENIDVLIVDGYVWLDDGRTPGLGAHLFHKLHGTTPVIGVAKTQYRQSKAAHKVLRGKSKKPLYITAVGIDPSVAASCIKKMHGKFRIPTMLKKVDQISKKYKYKILV